MEKEFAKKIKKLFEYQKFEDDPKINQIIKDSLENEFLPLSELELTNVTAGSNIEQINDACPVCGSTDLYIHIYNKSTHKEKSYCFKCNFIKETDVIK